MVLTSFRRLYVSVAPSVVRKTFTSTLDMDIVTRFDNGEVSVFNSGGDEEVIFVGPVDAVVHAVILVALVVTVVVVPGKVFILVLDPLASLGLINRFKMN